MSRINPKIGERILALRIERGLSQSDLAKAADVTQAHICRIERGKSDLSIAVLQAIARRLGVTEQAILGEGQLTLPFDLHPGLLAQLRRLSLGAQQRLADFLRSGAVPMVLVALALVGAQRPAQAAVPPAEVDIIHLVRSITTLLAKVKYWAKRVVGCRIEPTTTGGCSGRMACACS